LGTEVRNVAPGLSPVVGPVDGEQRLVERTQLAFVDLTQARAAESEPAERGLGSSGDSSDRVRANVRDHGFRASGPKPCRLADFAQALRTVMADD
jgi:hypothetical protein